MTRRKFIKKFITAGTVIIAGASWLVRKTVPPPSGVLRSKFVRALRVKKYPGSLKPLGDVSQQSKWSG
jgi:hypothetical protein